MSPVPDDDRDKHGDENVENMELPNVVIPVAADISDEDDEIEDESHGYQLLPQGLDDMNNGQQPGEDSEEEEENAVPMATGIVPSGMYPNFPEGDLPSYLQVPDLPRADKRDLLWNQPRQTGELVIDSNQAASIKAAMKGFELPKCNIPDWAKNISEEKWKEQVLTRLSPQGPTDTNLFSDKNTGGEASSQSSESSLSEPEKETG